MELAKIIGKKVVAIKGFKQNDKVKPEFILFSNKKTILNLTEQDYISYHDCSTMARYVTVIEDRKFWKNLFENFPDAEEDI